ncbi:MAG: hypothetical protein QXM96_03705 [Candidatus Woesearchaeota archaeon]
MNNWNYIGTMLKGNELFLYINGLINVSKTTNIIKADNFQNITIGKNFIGSLDEIKIYNFSLTEKQIFYEYETGVNNKSSNKIISNELTFNDYWICSVTPNDGYSDGITKNSTKIIINQNTKPRISNIEILPINPNTTSNLNCYATIIDDLNTTLLVEYFWYNGTNLFGSGNVSVNNNTNTLISTINSSQTKKGQEWNCTIRSFDGLEWTYYNSTKVIIINAPPSKPQLINPNNNNHTIKERKPLFLFNSTDVDGDDINYTIKINFTSTFECGLNILQNISESSYQSNYDFCTDQIINWSVIAFDGSLYSEWSETWNFTIESFLSINLTTNSVDFGSMNMLESKDTDNGYNPLIIENNGNVYVNVTKIGSNQSPFIMADLNTSYFRYKVDNTSEINSFDKIKSITEWENITSIDNANKTAIVNLNYSDANDEAQIDLNVTVPLYEPGGPKSVIIYVVGELA